MWFVRLRVGKRQSGQSISIAVFLSVLEFDLVSVGGQDDGPAL